MSLNSNTRGKSTKSIGNKTVLSSLSRAVIKKRPKEKVKTEKESIEENVKQRSVYMRSA